MTHLANLTRYTILEDDTNDASDKAQNSDFQLAESDDDGAPQVQSSKSKQKSKNTGTDAETTEVITPTTASAAPNVDFREMAIRHNAKMAKQTASAMTRMPAVGSSSRRTSLFPLSGKFIAARLKWSTNIVIFYSHRRGRSCVFHGVCRIRCKDNERAVRRRNGKDERYDG